MHQFAFLDCEDAAKWHGHAEAFSRLFPGLDIQWTVIRCYDGALPPVSELSSFEALALSGSHHSAADDEPRWIPQLAAWLADVVAHGPPNLRIVGLCFGSQILARALGGIVGKNPSGRFVLTVEQLRFEEALLQGGPYRRALPEALASASGGRVLESHGDQVLQLPPGAVRLATSPTAESDMWGAADGRVLAVQGHPEMACATALDKILPAVSSKMTEDEVAASRAALEHGATDDAAIMHFIAAFMCGSRITAGSASSDLTAAPSGGQHSSDGIGSRTDGQDEVAAVAGVLHRLSAHDSSLRPAEANGSGGRTAADAIASGQFNWGDGSPQAGATSAQGTTDSGVTDEQQEQQRLPAGGSAEAAQAMLSGQFQWGGGGSTPQPLPAAPAEAAGGSTDDPVVTAYGDVERQLDSLSAALDLLDQRSDSLAAKVAAQQSALQPHLPS